MAKPTPYLELGLKAMRRLINMAKNEESKRLIPILREKTMEHRNDLGHCPFCSQPIADTTVTYTEETAKDAIRIIYNWTIQSGKNEFEIGDIKHLLTKTQYANLNHLVAFGGIIYRPKNPKTGKQYNSKHYGIHRERAEQFLRGERPAPIQITRNRFSRERIDAIEGLADDLPRTSDLLDAEGNYSQPALMR